MKNIINFKTTLSVMVLTMGLLAACRDESVLVYDPAGTGVLGFYAKMIAQPAADVTVANALTQTYPFTPEVVGGKSSEVASFDISAELTEADGTNVKPKKLVTSITTFAEDATSKRPRGSVTVTAAQLNTALGMVIGDYVPGRIIVYHTRLNMTTRGFIDESNANPNLTGPAYNAPFFHQVTVK